jgi:hypothetical protein
MKNGDGYRREGIVQKIVISGGKLGMLKAILMIVGGNLVIKS